MSIFNEPLGMPRGSVRALIALIVVIATFAYFIVNKEFPEPLIGLLSGVVFYYFGSRTSETQGTEKAQILPQAE